MILPPELDRIIRALHTAGFRALIAGGAVRDDLLGLAPKDFDIEVYGISFENLAQLLAAHGRIDLVGQSFGVVKLTVTGGRIYNFSLPRRDSKIGRAHRDFFAAFDADITPREASSRRDFTINAMAFDPVANELLDFFGGREDLKNRVLRATSDAFREDPLRVLRGMQFACRFDLTIDPTTAAECRAIANEYSTIARERVAEEFMKWAVKSVRPGRIAEYLAAAGWIVHFPEIAHLPGVPQDPEWHPEGDVGVHTMLVVDAAARIAARDSLDDDERAVLLFSALTHDFAKADTTALRERNGRLRWTAHGHEAAGGPLARAFASASNPPSSIRWFRWSKIISRIRACATTSRREPFAVSRCVSRPRTSPSSSASSKPIIPAALLFPRDCRNRRCAFVTWPPRRPSPKSRRAR
jgi:tRNA nucleotidyltransferase (CCA-adding enzyme)